MTPAELLFECARAEAIGLSKVLLVLPRRVRGCRGLMRVMPGVLGEVCCENAAGHAVVWAPVAAIRLALAKAGVAGATGKPLFFAAGFMRAAVRMAMSGGVVDLTDGTTIRMEYCNG